MKLNEGFNIIKKTPHATLNELAVKRGAAVEISYDKTLSSTDFTYF